MQIAHFTKKTCTYEGVDLHMDCHQQIPKISSLRSQPFTTMYKDKHIAAIFQGASRVACARKKYDKFLKTEMKINEKFVPYVKIEASIST